MDLALNYINDIESRSYEYALEATRSKETVVSTPIEMSDYVITKTLYPKISASLSNTANVNRLRMAFEKFTGRNMDKLTTSGPLYRIIFSDADADVVFDTVGITRAEVNNLIKRSTQIDDSWKTIQPFFILMPLIIAYFHEKKNYKMETCMTSYLMLAIYPLLHFKYFKYEPNKAIMDYTINNLSNKFMLKKEGTIYQALLSTALNSNAKYIDLVTYSDKELLTYFQAIRTRLNTFMRNIANEFYKNEKEKNYLNTYLLEDAETGREQADNNSFIIAKISNAVTTSLIEKGPNRKLVRSAASMCDVSVNELNNVLLKLCVYNNMKEMKDFLSAILYIYTLDEKQSIDTIRTGKFLAISQEIYKRSNTTDSNIILIKQLLNKWLEAGSESYCKTQRKATLNNFRRALYCFMIFTIQSHS